MRPDPADDCENLLELSPRSPPDYPTDRAQVAEPLGESLQTGLDLHPNFWSLVDDTVDRDHNGQIPQGQETNQNETGGGRPWNVLISPINQGHEENAEYGRDHQRHHQA